jgi:uncharacterized protein (DUF1501 family)
LLLRRQATGKGELVAVHAVASPYRKRSHFDAQNVLELGLASPGESRQGWLNRALPLLAAENASRAEDYAMAIGQSVPLVLRGPEKVGSWAPARLPGPDDDLMERLVALYDGDAFLGPRLEAALNADRLAGGSPGGRGRPPVNSSANLPRRLPACWRTRPGRVSRSWKPAAGIAMPTKAVKAAPWRGACVVWMKV